MATANPVAFLFMYNRDMSEIEDYRSALHEIATWGDDRSSKVAHVALRKHDSRAHWCCEWDQLHIGGDSPEREACMCFDAALERDLAL